MRAENQTRIPNRWRYVVLAAAILLGVVSALAWFVLGEVIPGVIIKVAGVIFIGIGYILIVLWKRGEWKGGA